MEDHADIVEMLIDNYGVDVHSKDEVWLIRMLSQKFCFVVILCKLVVQVIMAR